MADNDDLTDGARFATSVPARHEAFPLKGCGALDWGMQSRLARVFRPESGRTVMLAIDHGYFQGPTTGLERVDLALIHDPDAHGEQALREAYPALERLRAEGVVRAIGVGMNQTEMLTRFVRETDIDVVLVAGRYTLLDRTAAETLLPAALERGVSVLAGGVFNSGVLAAPTPDATYDYAAAPGSLVSRALRLQEICAQAGVPLRAAAARFPLAHPAVASVLIGARNAAEVTDAIALRGLDIPPELWESLAAQEKGLA